MQSVFAEFSGYSLYLVIASCGLEEGGFYCTPAPRITSSPPTGAMVGQQYVYDVDASYNCGFWLCNSVDAVQLPPGAVIDDYYDSVTWTPGPGQANRDVRFVIAAQTDACGEGHAVVDRACISVTHFLFSVSAVCLYPFRFPLSNRLPVSLLRHQVCLPPGSLP